MDGTGFALQERYGGGLVLSGRPDVAVAADVRLALAATVEADAGDRVLDVSGLTGVDTTGVGVLVGAHRRARRVLVLHDVLPVLGRVLTMTRLDRELRTTVSA